MKPIFGEARDNVPILNEPSVGHFAPDTEPPKPLIWEKCREQFAVKFLSTLDGFYYCQGEKYAESVAGFLSKTEKILEVDGKNDSKTTFHRTVRKSVIYLRPSTFWKKCEMRRSLLTLLLRCGSRYDPECDNFEDALYGGMNNSDPQEYARVTKPAIVRFMFGFTKFVPPSGYMRINYSDTIHRQGWVEVFRDKSLEYIRDVLVAPSENESENSNPVGFCAVWA